MEKRRTPLHSRRWLALPRAQGPLLPFLGTFWRQQLGIALGAIRLSRTAEKARSEELAAGLSRLTNGALGLTGEDSCPSGGRAAAVNLEKLLRRRLPDYEDVAVRLGPGAAMRINIFLSPAGCARLFDMFKISFARRIYSRCRFFSSKRRTSISWSKCTRPL